MPKVVSNTTPIISLLKIDKLEVLKDLYGEVFIPHEVFNEIEAGKNKEYYTDLFKIEWIKVVKIKNEKSLSYFLDSRGSRNHYFSHRIGGGLGHFR